MIFKSAAQSNTYLYYDILFIIVWVNIEVHYLWAKTSRHPLIHLPAGVQ